MTTKPSSIRQSARAIITDAGHVALIERKRGGKHFFVFPGGTVEPGESSAQAVTREVEEELGLIVQPNRIVAEVAFPDRVQAFWLVERVGGDFGTGTGPEMTRDPDSRKGSYRPIWMPIANVLGCDVLPRCIAAELIHRHETGWPSEVLRFTDDLMWWSTD